jgi:hypothetical protein
MIGFVGLVLLSMSGGGTLEASGGPLATSGDAFVETQGADSTRIHRDARRAQENFERFRENRIPAERMERGGRCDEPIGRFCLTFGRDGETPPPIGAAPRPIQDARAELLDELETLAQTIPGDGWITGQRVRYLVESGDVFQARTVADRCAAEPWWCSALLGWVLHEDGDWVEAGRAFDEALEQMPAAERSRWTGESYLLERDGRRALETGDAAERERRRMLLWRLSDPLFLIPGNDRWTAHMARLTQARVLEDAWNPFGLPWDIDLEEVLLRYGWAMGWERAQGALQARAITTHNMVARLDPDRRRYLPMGEDLDAFPFTEDDALRVLEGRQTEGYTPRYAPFVENLGSQTARFRRGDEIMVLHAFAADAPRDRARVGDGGIELPRDLRTALFLLPLEGPMVEVSPIPVEEGRTLADVWTAWLPDGVDHILSLEAFSRIERKAWRTRRGIPALPTPQGSISVSDPVFLSAAPDDLPVSLDEAMADMLPTVRFQAGSRIRIGWEVYGIPEGQSATVALGIERAEQSLARRIGEFLRVLEAPAPVVIRWDDGGDAEPGTVFRAVDLQMPALDPGRYDLYLEIKVGDEAPAVTRRRFVLEPEQP